MEQLTEKKAVAAEINARLSAIAAWLKEHGTRSQQERFSEGMLPESELKQALREVAFIPLDEIPRYVALKTGDCSHAPGCAHDGAVVFKSRVAEDLEEAEHDLLKKVREICQAAGADFTVSPREHYAICSNDACSEWVAYRFGVLVSTKAFGLDLSREYSLS